MICIGPSPQQMMRAVRWVAESPDLVLAVSGFLSVVAILLMEVYR